MRIYVGTLHTIENEFDDCVASIQRQTYPDFEHFVFSGLGNEEAHRTLYRDFSAKSDEFDLLIKVDADMVLLKDDLFKAIARRFDHPELQLLQIAVHDWYSDRLIGSLNSYRRGVRWRGDSGKLFVDNVEVDSTGRESDWADLAPAAVHCPDPSPFQAFHYGLHKAMKVIQPYTAGTARVKWRMREHWDNLALTEKHFERSGDRRLGLAVLASELAFAGTFQPEHVSYDHPEPKRVFERFDKLNPEAIGREIRRLRFRNAGRLSPQVRRAWLWYRFRRRRLSLCAIRALIADACMGNRRPKGQ